MPKRTGFLKEVELLMKDDPLLKAIKAQTPEQVTNRLEALGVLENGEISQSYLDKFKGSRAPVRGCNGKNKLTKGPGKIK